MTIVVPGGGSGGGAVDSVTAKDSSLTVAPNTGDVVVSGQELELSYNGVGPVPCQVLDGLAYDPTAGGFIFIVIPAALPVFGQDVPAVVFVDNTATIQAVLALVTTPGHGNIIALDGSGNASPITISSSTLIDGNLSTNLDVESGPYSVQPNDSILITGGDITLPVPGTSTGIELWFCDNGSGTTVLLPNVSETIAGEASLSLSAFEGIGLTTDGTNWYALTPIGGGGGGGLPDYSGTVGVSIEDNSTSGVVITESGASPITVTGAGGIGLVDTSSDGIILEELGTGPIGLSGTGGISLNDTSGEGIQIVETGAGSVDITASAGLNFVDDSTDGMQFSETGASAIALKVGGNPSLVVQADGIATGPTVQASDILGLIGIPNEGIALTNPLDYDVMFNLSFEISVGTAGGQITLDVGTQSAVLAPSPVTVALTGAQTVSVAGILPAGYQLEWATTGTIVVGSVIAFYTPL